VGKLLFCSSSSCLSPSCPTKSPYNDLARWVALAGILVTGDESAMNFEAVGVSFWTFFVFRSIFANRELTSQRPWLARQSRPNKLYRAGDMLNFGESRKGEVPLIGFLRSSF
jgi:hypothetical protein